MSSGLIGLKADWWWWWTWRRIGCVGGRRIVCVESLPCDDWSSNDIERICSVNIWQCSFKQRISSRFSSISFFKNLNEEKEKVLSFFSDE